MARYTVVIRPEDSGKGIGGEVTVVVETGPPSPRIVEMTIRATSTEGASVVGLPSIDLEGVVNVLSAGMCAADSAAVPTPSVTPDPAPPPAVTVAEADDAVAEADTVEVSQALPRPARRSDRPYRHMPAVQELKGVYEQNGTVGAVAAHYDVPRHTARGWIDRLRKMNG